MVTDKTGIAGNRGLVPSPVTKETVVPLADERCLLLDRIHESILHDQMHRTSLRLYSVYTQRD
jgi:hypothetical protein